MSKQQKNTAQKVAHNIGERIGILSPITENKGSDTVIDNPIKWTDLVDARSHLKSTQTNDKSQPLIDKNIHISKNHHKQIFEEIKQDHHLKNVLTDDRSAPMIDRSIHITEAPQKRIFAEIPQHHDLKHVKIEHDTSAPVIPKNVQILRQTKVIE